jgi:hypothetical protein
VTLTPHPLLMPRSKNRVRLYLLISLTAFVACKKGETTKPLLCTGYKILTTVLNNRLKKFTEHIIGEYQAGFRTGKSTIDQIFTVIFVDFQKAFDSIRKDKL